MRGLTTYCTPAAVSSSLHGVEMRAAFVAQVIEALGRRLGQLRVDLAVEQAQRIAIEAIVAVLAQLVPDARGPIRRSASRNAGRHFSSPIELISNRQLELEVAAQLVDHHHQLGVAGRVGAAENLDAELIELAKAALLRTLATEHRTRVVEALLRVAAIEAGLDIGAHHAGRAFGPQRDSVVSASSRSVKVYICFSTTSEVSPLERW